MRILSEQQFCAHCPRSIKAELQGYCDSSREGLEQVSDETLDALERLQACKDLAHAFGTEIDLPVPGSQQQMDADELSPWYRTQSI